MSAILAGFGINTSGSPRRLAQRDTEAYWRRLLALGGTDINANDEVTRIQDFLVGVFDMFSPVDAGSILLLRSGQSVGTGAAFPALLGPNGDGVDGPEWGTAGTRFAPSTASRIRWVPPAYFPANDQLSFFGVIDLIQSTDLVLIMGIRDSAFGDFRAIVPAGTTNLRAVQPAPSNDQLLTTSPTTFGAGIYGVTGQQSAVSGPQNLSTTTGAPNTIGTQTKRVVIGMEGTNNETAARGAGAEMRLGLAMAMPITLTQSQYNALRALTLSTLFSDLTIN